MLFSVNLALALALCATAFVTTALGKWFTRHFQHPLRLRDVAVMSALVLAPVNLVFTATRPDETLLSATTTLSSLVLVAQLVLALRWRVRRPATPPTLAETARAEERAALLDDIEDLDDVPVQPRRLRILAVGASQEELDYAAGGLLDELRLAGHEVYALVMANSGAASLASATRTIVVGYPRAVLADLIKPMTGAVVEQVESLGPDLIVGPAAGAEESAETAIHRATRYAIDGRIGLYYSPEGRGDAATEPPAVPDWAFQRPTTDDDRVTMPIFGTPWA